MLTCSHNVSQSICSGMISSVSTTTSERSRNSYLRSPWGDTEAYPGQEVCSGLQSVRSEKGIEIKSSLNPEFFYTQLVFLQVLM